MRIHRSGDKSVEFFISYMNLILLAEKARFEYIEDYMVQHFFQHDVFSLGPITYENFKKALLTIERNEA